MDQVRPRALVYHAFDPSFLRSGHSDFVLSEIPAPVSWNYVYDNLLPSRKLEVQDQTFKPPTLSDLTGLEDARIITFNGSLFFTATLPHVKIADSIADSVFFAQGPYLGRLNAERTGIERLFKVGEGVLKEPIKNVVPFVDGDVFGLFDAFTGMGYHVRDPYCSTAADQEVVPLFRLAYPRWLRGGVIRGGTSPVRLANGVWGCFVHASFSMGTDPGARESGAPPFRIAQDYVHLWMEFDPRSGRFSLSRPFYFLGGAVEFASGLLLLSEDELVVSIGYQDVEAYLISVRLSDLRALPALYKSFGIGSRLSDRSATELGGAAASAEPLHESEFDEL